MKDYISNIHQVGGIETSTLDNGPGKGTRIAWVNTGTGLRYKVVIDRTMDIADAFFNHHSLAWLSHSGITAPGAFPVDGMEWLRSFGGGLLTTCGLSHIGGPETDEYGERNLHGLISNTSCELTEIKQPDLLSGDNNMQITGTMRETSVFGPRLELRRTISASLGMPVIKIHDEILNCGNEASPFMLLYHINFGWPLVDKETKILWDGEWKSRGTKLDNLLFKEGNNFKKCLPYQMEHSGNGEACAFIDVNPNSQGICSCGLYNPEIELAFMIKFKKEQLPWLTNWQHWGKREYVTALEPGTNPPIGQKAAREQKTLIYLEPGEKRNFELEMEVFTDAVALNDILKMFA